LIGFRNILEEKTSETPGTLAEIEEVTQEIAEQIKREIEESFCGSHGSGYVGPRMPCSCGGVCSFKGYYKKRRVSLSGEHVVRRAYYYGSGWKSGFAPVDAQMGIDGLCISIGVRKRIARLAAWIPF